MRRLLWIALLVVPAVFAQSPDSRLATQREAMQMAIINGQTATVAGLIKGGLALDFNYDATSRGFSTESPLTHAIHRNRLEIARMLLEAGAAVKRLDGAGQAAIHGVRSAEAIKLLLSHGADLEQPDHNARTALVSAVDRGESELIEWLLDAGARLDPPMKGTDLLALAADRKQWNAFDRLLERGLDPRKPPTQAAWTLIEGNDLLRLKAVLKAGADPDTHNDRDWLITRALFRQRWEMVEALVDAGANLKLPDRPGCGRSFQDCPPIQIARLATLQPALLRKLVARGLDLNAAGSDGHTALTALILEQPLTIRVARAPSAVQGVALDVATGRTQAVIAPAVPQPAESPAPDNAARVRALLDAGADANRKLGDLTPLMLAIASSGRAPEIAHALVDAGGRVESDSAIPPPPRDGSPPFALTSGRGNLESAMAIANVQGEITGLRVGPITWALLRGRADVAARLLARDRRLTPADRHAIYFAAALNAWDVVIAATSLTRDVNAGNRAGVTPLMLAADAGEVAAVKALLAAGADVNARSDREWPPLLERPVLSFLAGHSPSRPRLVGGYTALRAAGERNHAEIVKLLRDAGAKS